MRGSFIQLLPFFIPMVSCNLLCIFFYIVFQFQSSLQVRFEKERRELEQAQSKLVKQLETRLDQLETSNKVNQVDKLWPLCSTESFVGVSGCVCIASLLLDILPKKIFFFEIQNSTALNPPCHSQPTIFQ